MTKFQLEYYQKKITMMRILILEHDRKIYTNQHICDVNTIHRTLDTFDNNYGLVRRNMNVLDMLRTLKTRSDHQGGGLLTVFSQITLYTFTLCIRLRTELRLPSLDGYKDVYIVKYLTRIDVGEDNNDIEN